MNTKTLEFTQSQLKKDVPNIEPGQTVKVHQKITEGDKKRVQVYEGVVIAIKGDSPINKTITVRKESFGIGVERIFPLHSPAIEKIEVIKSAKVRRAKLYYLRRQDIKMKNDKAKQEKVEKMAADLETKRKKETELKAQREAARKARSATQSPKESPSGASQNQDSAPKEDKTEEKKDKPIEK